VRSSKPRQAEWDQRIISVVEAFPLLLFKMLESPSDDACETRKHVASKLLATPACCLREVSSDVASKMKSAFANDFQHAATTGRLTRTLHAALHLLRAQMAADTQYIEGLMNLVQVSSQQRLIRSLRSSHKLVHCHCQRAC